jgi:hypothetical protein
MASYAETHLHDLEYIEGFLRSPYPALRLCSKSGQGSKSIISGLADFSAREPSLISKSENEPLKENPCPV